MRPAQTFTFFQYDYIVVSYGCTGDVCSGYTQNWVLVGAQLNSMNQWVPIWQRVGSSLKYKGKPLTPPAAKPGRPINPGGMGGTTGSSWNTDTNIAQSPYPNLCYGTSSGEVSLGGETLVSFGDYLFPC